MNENKFITLRTVFGDFVFDSTVIKSHAKLVRDAAMGYLSERRGKKLPTTEEVQQWVFNQCRGTFSETPFEFIAAKPSSERR